MYAVNATHFRQNFKATCDRVQGRESLIITRPNHRNLIMISEDRYAELEKAERNAEYLAKIDRGFEQLRAGKGQVHDLIED